MADETMMRNRILDCAVNDLQTINYRDIKRRSKDLVKKSIGRAVETNDPLFWPAGMVLLGLAEAAGSEHFDDAKREEAKAAASAYFAQHAAGNFAVPHIDDALAGYAALKLYTVTGDDRFRGIAAQIKDAVSAMPKDKEGTFIYNPSHGRDDVFADGVGMSAMLLIEYGRIHAEIDTVRIGASQITNFMRRGLEERTMLPYHGYSLTDDLSEGIIGWGRAAAWLMMGCAVLHDAGEELQVGEFRDTGRVYAKHMAGFVREDGTVPWLLSAIKGPADLSATAMLLYAMKKTKPEVPEEVFQSMRDAVLRHTDENGAVGQILSPCEDFAVHRQVYGHYPYGQGAALAALSIL